MGKLQFNLSAKKKMQRFFKTKHKVIQRIKGNLIL